MEQKEMQFQPLSRHKKNSPTSMPVSEVEAWLDQFPQKRAENKPNGGIIRATAAVTFIDMLTREPSSAAEKKRLVAQAQKEHQKALKELAKQEAIDAKEIAKQLTKWKIEAAKKEISQEELAAKKEAARIKRNERNRVERMGGGRPKVRTEMPTQKGQQVLDQLKSEGIYQVSDWPLSRKYLEVMIYEARQLGYAVENIKAGTRTTHYRLDRQ